MNIIQGLAIAAGLIVGGGAAVVVTSIRESQIQQSLAPQVKAPQEPKLPIASPSKVQQLTAQQPALNIDQPSSQPHQASTATSIQAEVSVAAPASNPVVSKPIAFEDLSACEQLDSIARSGQSVAEFLVAAAKVNDWNKYETAIDSICSWNAEQLQLADQILHPPVIVTAPTVTISGTNEFDSSSDTILWNDCDGVQEPGESYSDSCEDAQRENDWILKHGAYRPLNPIDQRPPWQQPSQNSGSHSPDPPYARGYAAQSVD